MRWRTAAAVVATVVVATAVAVGMVVEVMVVEVMVVDTAEVFTAVAAITAVAGGSMGAAAEAALRGAETSPGTAAQPVAASRLGTFRARAAGSLADRDSPQAE